MISFQKLQRYFFLSTFLVLIFPVTGGNCDSKPADSIAQYANHPQWRALLHYHPSTFTSAKSLADDPSFFLSKNGKYNPEEELREHLVQLEQSDIRCKFVARYFWLSQVFKFDFDPFKECADFSKWYEALNPARLSLIFPSVYINNPASAFGHTFIRIDTATGDNLTAYAANYAAATQGENALFYALKGIFGGYQGFFNIAPYYQLVRKYSDLENRDIWEYQLDFTPAEVQLLVMHLWELRKIAFDYYYFDENCSYHLLSLLDVARPSLELVDQFQLYTLPSETIRILAHKHKLLKKPVYRPASLTVLRNSIKQSSKSSKQLAKKVVDHRAVQLISETNLQEQDKAESLDLAQDYLSYLAFKGKILEAEHKKLGYDLLIERSRYDEAVEFKEPIGEDPLTGHGTFRLSSGIGAVNGKGYYELGVRPVYHSLTDPLLSHSIGSQLELGEISVRQFRDEKLKLQHFDLIDIYSLVPRDDFVRPLSWRLKIGTERMQALDQELLSSAKLNFGYTLGSQKFLAYALWGPNLAYSDGFQAESYQLNAEFLTGIAYYQSNYQLQLFANYQSALTGSNFDQARISFSPSYIINTNQQLRLEFNYDYFDERYFREGKLLLEFFF